MRERLSKKCHETKERPLRVLITGFGPFPGAPFNPTQQLVRRLQTLRRPALDAVERSSHIFTVSYGDVDRDLPRLLAEQRPDVLLMFGLAARTPHVRIETRARNAITTIWPDAAGTRIGLGKIAPGEAEALTFGPHTARLLRAALQTDVMAKSSRDAGRYLCNYLCWRVIETMARPAGPKFAAFVHIPKLRQVARRRASRARPAWRMADLLRGGEAILHAAAVETRKRIRMTKR